MREGIAGFYPRLNDSSLRVTNDSRLLLARSLATDALALLPEDASRLPDAELHLWINLSYDVMLAMVDLFKESVEIPKVPRRS
ncbi:MAG: hypothetical protein L3K19_04340 [Thermoplasmata archaeon]|nr:hypothetical protein [Thermoplasmata archaeon]